MKSRISPEKLEEIKKSYGHYASWVIWAEEGSTPKSKMCSAVFDDNSIIDELHTDYILVALNISRAIDLK